MADDLHDALTDIHGIGDAKAEAIRDVLDDHGGRATDGEVHDLLTTAHDHFPDHPGHAEKFVRQAIQRLER